MEDKENDRLNYIFEDGKIKVRLTKDMLKDPDEPGLHPLEKASRELNAEFLESGLPVYSIIGYSGTQPRYQASFMPRKKQTREPGKTR